MNEGTLLLAMADPTNVLALDDVQMATGLNCAVAVAPADDIEALVTKLGTMQSTVSDAITEERRRRRRPRGRRGDHRSARLGAGRRR